MSAGRTKVRMKAAGIGGTPLPCGRVGNALEYTERLTRTGVRGKPSTNGKRFRGARVSKRSLTRSCLGVQKTVFERVEKLLGSGARQ